ncbi:MAG: hypothetical protein K2P70_05780 [Hyphomonadaceae bacterium]|nr:hypothetical protein [Hyphomonadaceae bacterium]
MNFDRLSDEGLSAIFNELYFGGSREGWRYEDLSGAQMLASKAFTWARQIDDHGNAGAWTLLPCSKVEARRL